MRILCWVGLHAWAYAFGYTGGGPMQERRCFRCETVQAPYLVRAANAEREAA